MRKITVEQLHAEFKAQGVKNRDDIAFVCPRCHTVQSLALFNTLTSVPVGEAEGKYIGFSCIGRFTDAGAAKGNRPRRGKVGCDWTLGGFFTIHELVVKDPDGEEHPSFEVATAAAAQKLASRAKDSAKAKRALVVKPPPAEPR